MAEYFHNSRKYDSAEDKELLSHYFDSLNDDFNRCFAPGVACTNKAIRAHSIQNSRVMDLLSRNGHVKMIVPRPRKDLLTIDFADVGRNEASTFSGFCSEHDSKLFLPIDNNPFDPTNQEHLFLIAYRAVVRELHACMAGAIKIQGGYQKRVELGFDTGNVPEEAGMMAIERIAFSYETYLYKSELDKNLLAKNFSSLVHTVFTVEHSSPCFAVSGFFDLFAVNDRGERSRISLNVFPLSNDLSAVIVSRTVEDDIQVAAYVQTLMSATGEYQKYLLSKLVLMHCENFVISPTVFETWPATRVDAICKFCIDTLRYDKEVEDANLFLF